MEKPNETRFFTRNEDGTFSWMKESQTSGLRIFARGLFNKDHSLKWVQVHDFLLPEDRELVSHALGMWVDASIEYVMHDIDIPFSQGEIDDISTFPNR